MPLVFCQVIQAKAVFIHYLEVDKALQRQRLAKKYNTMALQCDAQTWISWNRVEYTHNEADKPNMWHGIRIALLSSKLFPYQEIPAENHRWENQLHTPQVLWDPDNNQQMQFLHKSSKHHTRTMTKVVNKIFLMNFFLFNQVRSLLNITVLFLSS